MTTHDQAFSRMRHIFQVTWLDPDHVTNRMKQELALEARRCWHTLPSRFLRVSSNAARDQLIREFPRLQ